MTDLIAPVIAEVRLHHPSINADDIQRAYITADKAHEGQLRKSGEPYITHPVAVAGILAELGLDRATIIAALLHDTVEDTPYNLAQLKSDFGDEVASLVDGVTKLEDRKSTRLNSSHT